MNKTYPILMLILPLMSGIVWKSNHDRLKREQEEQQQFQQYMQKMAQLEVEYDRSNEYPSSSEEEEVLRHIFDQKYSSN